MPAIVFDNVSKFYGDVKAVDGLSLEVSDGEIFALLGPNGAGKTTTISILATLVRPTSGRVLVDGVDVWRYRDRVRRMIAYAPQELALDMLLSVYDNLDLYARLQGVPSKERRNKIEEVLRIFELSDKRRARIIELSGGLQRRVQLARVFLVNKPLILLDEPTLGLDPAFKLRAWELLKEKARREKATVILCTNDLNEARYMADRVAFINKGRLVAIGSIDELRKRVGRTALEIEVNPSDIVRFSPKDLKYYVRGNTIVVEVEDPRDLSRALGHIARSEVIVRDIKTREISLEELFVKLLG